MTLQQAPTAMKIQQGQIQQLMKDKLDIRDFQTRQNTSRQSFKVFLYE